MYADRYGPSGSHGSGSRLASVSDCAAAAAAAGTSPSTSNNNNNTSLHATSIIASTLQHSRVAGLSCSGDSGVVGPRSTNSSSSSSRSTKSSSSSSTAAADAYFRGDKLATMQQPQISPLVTTYYSSDAVNAVQDHFNRSIDIYYGKENPRKNSSAKPKN